MAQRVNRQRRQAFREPRLRLLVVCGGERTEPAYFRGLKRYVRNPAIQIRVKSKGWAPRDLVEYARSIAPVGADEFDEVWCVVDRDEFDLESAVIRATELDVRLAVSNPYFELWLLLHHDDCTAEMGDAKRVLQRLARKVSGYRRTNFGSPILKMVWMMPCGVPNDSIQA
ncbi:MAG: RloB family protein, partial [Actinobacteria bacterium]|nr:RloB family protein [Actinomycetota bacterium]